MGWLFFFLFLFSSISWEFCVSLKSFLCFEIVPTPFCLESVLIETSVCPKSLCSEEWSLYSAGVCPAVSVTFRARRSICRAPHESWVCLAVLPHCGLSAFRACTSACCPSFLALVNLERKGLALHCQPFPSHITSPFSRILPESLVQLTTRGGGEEHFGLAPGECSQSGCQPYPLSSSGCWRAEGLLPKALDWLGCTPGTRSYSAFL